MTAPRDPGDERGSDPRPANPQDLPRQRSGVVPQMRGRYPDWDVLSQADHWDAETRRVVLERVDDVPPIRFFGEDEARSLHVFCDTVMAQTEDPRIPVLSFIDDKLFRGRSEGYQYASMPKDGDTWRLLARGLDERARSLEAPGFADAPVDVRIRIVGELQRGELGGGVWERLDPQLTWKVVMNAVLDAFYSHPWAWNEIGFSGPAYPRGFARMGVGLKEAWEPEEAFELDPVRDVAERGLDL